jgi:hypothetical protein
VLAGSLLNVSSCSGPGAEKSCPFKNTLIPHAHNGLDARAVEAAGEKRRMLRSASRKPERHAVPGFAVALKVTMAIGELGA